MLKRLLRFSILFVGFFAAVFSIRAEQIDGEKMRAFYLAYQDFQADVKIALKNIEAYNIGFYESREHFIFHFASKLPKKIKEKIIWSSSIPKSAVKKSVGESLNDETKAFEIDGAIIKAFLISYEDFQTWKFDKDGNKYIENYRLSIERSKGGFLGKGNKGFLIELQSKHLLYEKGKGLVYIIRDERIGGGMMFCVGEDYKIIRKLVFR